MTSRDFCFWLQGYFEINGISIDSGLPKSIDCLQAQTIQRHLSLVFKHEIDPSQGSKEHQEELQFLHDGKQPKFGGIGPNGEIYRC